MDWRHKSEGRKPRPYRPYRFTVQGFDRGVPFMVYHRTFDGAVADLDCTNSSITDLRSGKTLKWINGSWKVIAYCKPDFSVPPICLKDIK